MTDLIVTYRLRLKDKHASELNRQARSVNVVWNFCNETQQRAVRDQRKWLSDIDLQRLTSGSSKLLGLDSATIGRVCRQYVRSRIQHKKAWLRFRGRRSLGWVPFRDQKVTFDGSAFSFRGHRYEPMHKRDIPPRLMHEGSFSRDRRGRWYINARVTVCAAATASRPSVGIDLGLKDLAVRSTGERIVNLKPYRSLEGKLGRAQRAGKTKLARHVSEKISNVRADHLHKTSAWIAKTYGLIFVGNISSTKLARTSMAKGVQDASWGTFRKQLQYKAMAHGGSYFEVDERNTTRMCSRCGEIPDSSPKGMGALGIREWTCACCGATHDRDVNGALNILARGMASLVEGAAPARSIQIDDCMGVTRRDSTSNTGGEV